MLHVEIRHPTPLVLFALRLERLLPLLHQPLLHRLLVLVPRFAHVVDHARIILSQLVCGFKSDYVRPSEALGQGRELLVTPFRSECQVQ